MSESRNVTAEPTAAEIEAAARALADPYGHAPESFRPAVSAHIAAGRALTAALPLIEARLREQIAGEHAAELERLRAAVRQAFDAVDWNSDGYNPGVGRAILRDALTPDAD